MASPPIERGTHYAAFIEAELTREIARRDSLNTRALAALTASTGLATLVLGLFAVVIGKDATIKDFAKYSTLAAILALLASAVFAVLAVKPKKAYVTGVKSLEAILSEDYWAMWEPHARWQTSSLVIAEIERLRPETTKRGKRLVASAVLQVVAVACLAASASVVVFSAPDNNLHADDSHHITPAPSVWP